MDNTIARQLKGKKILFATVPADGHFNPLTGFAKYLQALGCDVRWYTSAIFADKLARLNIHHYTYSAAMDINAMNAHEKLPQRAAIEDSAARLNFDLINVFEKRAPEYFLDIQELYQDFHFELLVADSMFSAIPFVRIKLKIPVIAIGIVPLAEDSVDLAPYGTGLLPSTNQAEREAYAGMRETLHTVVFKEAIDTFENILHAHRIPHQRSMLFDVLIRQSDLYLQIGSPSFEYSRTDLGDNIRYVGSMLPYFLPGQRASWFDEKLSLYDRIVLVTQGTVERDFRKILIPTLEAFRGTDTLVIATTGGNGTEELRRQFGEENLIIEDFIPFNDVMPYASVFVTNGGYSGTVMSINNHLPMVAAGVHEGKNEICARIGYFEYGINLHTESPTPQAIREAVDTVISHKKYKENVARLFTEMSALNPLELSARYASEVINEPVSVG